MEAENQSEDSIPMLERGSYLVLRPVHTERLRLRFSVQFNVESVFIYHWCLWETQTQTLGVNSPLHLDVGVEGEGLK